MYGQMTAGSWIYIGTQGILQGTFETFAELARQHFGGTLRGPVTLTAGLGGMGGAQPLAVTMNEGVCLAIEVDEARARRRLEIGYVDRLTHDPAEALAWARAAAADGEANSIALVGNAAEIEPAWAAAGERFDVVTDQTSAHDALAGYVPAEISLDDAAALRASQPDVYERRSRARWPTTSGRCSRSRRAGAVVVRLRQQPPGPGAGGGRRGRLRLSGLRARVHPAAVLRGARAVPLGGAVGRSRRTSRRTDRAILELFPDDAGLRRWIEMAEARVPFQGLPARICWLGYGERARAGLEFNRAGRRRARSARRSSSAATTSTRARWPRPTARPRRWPTAPTRSPTGRCSTRWSTPRPGRPGCRSTTAAAWASATASTPGWSSSRTARSSPRGSWSGC